MANLRSFDQIEPPAKTPTAELPVFNFDSSNIMGSLPLDGVVVVQGTDQHSNNRLFREIEGKIESTPGDWRALLLEPPTEAAISVVAIRQQKKDAESFGTVHRRNGVILVPDLAAYARLSATNGASRNLLGLLTRFARRDPGTPELAVGVVGDELKGLGESSESQKLRALLKVLHKIPVYHFGGYQGAPLVTEDEAEQVPMSGRFARQQRRPLGGVDPPHED